MAGEFWCYEQEETSEICHSLDSIEIPGIKQNCHTLVDLVSNLLEQISLTFPLRKWIWTLKTSDIYLNTTYSKPKGNVPNIGFIFLFKTFFTVDLHVVYIN